MFSFLRIINAGGNQYCGLLFFTMFLGAHGFMISKNFHTGSESRILKKPTSTMRTPVSSLLYRRETMNSTTTLDIPLDRFHRQASTTQEVDEDCILTIENKKYNLTAFGKAHPGGHKILQRFHNRDATKAFEAAHHSSQAYAMLDDFRMVDDTIKTAKKDDINDSVVEINGSNNHAIPIAKTSCPVVLSSVVARTVRNQKQSHPGRLLRRMKHKLFTKEDPIGIHKYLGMFCLLNFIGRYRQMWFGVDPAAGLGSQGHPWFSIACLIPHAMLSLSSLIFHTVPKERVVGKPMIWQEYRVHNIIFGVRSVLSALATAMAIKAGNTPLARKTAVIFVGGLVLLANWGADVATDKLRASNVESTTATMPYWKGCSLETQRRFKGFYAYCQFMATLACLVSNILSFFLLIFESSKLIQVQKY